MNTEGVWFIFFFSSRRRHTRCLSDWSSDVCSSDLERGVSGEYVPSRRSIRHHRRPVLRLLRGVRGKFRLPSANRRQLAYQADCAGERPSASSVFSGSDISVSSPRFSPRLRVSASNTRPVRSRLHGSDFTRTGRSERREIMPPPNRARAVVWKPLVVCPQPDFQRRLHAVLTELAVEQPCTLVEYPRAGAIAVLVERHACNICFLDRK